MVRTRLIEDIADPRFRRRRTLRRLGRMLAASVLVTLAACGPAPDDGPCGLAGTWRRGLPGVETDVLEISIDGDYRRLHVERTETHEETGRVVQFGGRFHFAPRTLDGVPVTDSEPSTLANEVFVRRTREGRTWLLSTRSMEGWESFVDDLTQQSVPTTYCPHFAPLLAGG